MPIHSRKQRLESLLHREIATTIQRDLRDPRIGFLTITRAELSDDLHLVTAYYTVLGTEAQKRTAARALANAVGFVQRAYAPAIHTRLLPMLSFVYDDREAKRQNMDDLIRRARASDPDPTPEPSPEPGRGPNTAAP